MVVKGAGAMTDDLLNAIHDFSSSDWQIFFSFLAYSTSGFSLSAMMMDVDSPREAHGGPHSNFLPLRARWSHNFQDCPSGAPLHSGRTNMHADFFVGRRERGGV